MKHYYTIEFDIKGGFTLVEGSPNTNSDKEMEVYKQAQGVLESSLNLLNMMYGGK